VVVVVFFGAGDRSGTTGTISGRSRIAAVTMNEESYETKKSQFGMKREQRG